MLKRRQFITTTTASLAALSLPLSAQTGSKLTLWGPPVTPSVLLAIAARDGKAKDIRPFAVQIWRSPDQLRAGLLNGDIAASIVPSYVAANLYNQGRKVKLFNIMSEGLNYIAAPATDGKPLVTSLAELATHSVVIPFKNDMPDLLLQILYKKAGLEFANIHYTATPPEALVMFLSGKVDCAMLPEPLLSLAQFKGNEKYREIVRALDVQQLWAKPSALRRAYPSLACSSPTISSATIRSSSPHSTMTSAPPSPGAKSIRRKPPPLPQSTCPSRKKRWPPPSRTHASPPSLLRALTANCSISTPNCTR